MSQPTHLPRLGALLMTVAIGGCSEPPPPPPPPPAEVTVIEVAPQDTPVWSEFVGKTASSRKVEIRARVEGFLEEHTFVEGTMVDEDEILFEMDKKPFEAQLRAANAELAQQDARLENATAQLNRIRPLAEKKAVAQKELDDAIGMHLSSAAAVEAAKAKVVQAELNLSYCTIRSPVAGLTSYTLQEEGAYLGFADSLLTYVAQLQPMWVEFSVSENQVLSYRADTEAGILALPGDEEYEVEIILADGTVFPERGRITFTDASISDETGTFLIRAELPNADAELRPGMFVRVRLHGAYRPNAIKLPQRAVQQGAKGSFVWVIDGDEARLQPVTPSGWLQDDWFIDEGLEGGEKVVLDGGSKLQTGVKVTIVEPSADESAAKPE
ncbi:MAG: efflux RND transporter periplasmic adaptor subunit [Planctomycetes bacterium]|nr:efflux RND transporter periplasmic adaptor subunit [Planctomycetota bacterium]